MGLSIEFYAGNANNIGEAFSEVEFDAIRNGTAALAYSDLLLHLAPGTLTFFPKSLGFISAWTRCS